MSRVASALAGTLVVACVAACNQLGDRAQPMSFVNRTGQVVVLYQYGRGYPATRRTLTVDQRLDTDYLDPHLKSDDDKVKFRVEATTTGDELLYCHEFTWKEFSGLKWLVELRVANDCT